MTPENLRRVDDYWSAELHCPPEDAAASRVEVVRDDWPGLFLFRRGERLVLTAPGPLLAWAGGRAERFTSEELFGEERLRAELGRRVDRFVGPAWLGYADGESFHPVAAEESPRVRMVGDEDLSALRRLADAAGAEAWEHSGIRPGEQPVAAWFEGDGEIAAAAGYEVWGGAIAHLGVVARPDARGRGCGRAVVSAAGRHALGRGLVLQYRTLAANAPSMAIARALGFGEYARTLAVRLRPEGG